MKSKNALFSSKARDQCKRSAFEIEFTIIQYLFQSKIWILIPIVGWDPMTDPCKHEHDNYTNTCNQKSIL